MNIFFNELSIRQAEHSVIAKEWMSKLMVLYKTACDSGFKGFRISEQVLQQNLSNGYTLNNWVVDKTVDEIARKLFLSEISKYPFIDKVINGKSSDEKKLFEFKYNGKNANGLGAAYLFSSLAMSFDNDSQWDNRLVKINVTTMTCDDEMEVITTEGDVNHSSKSVHLNELSEWILFKKKTYVADGVVVWEKRLELFPHLIFCENTKNELASLKESNPEFIQVRHKLFALEDYCAKWASGSFNPDGISYKSVPESDSRKSQLKSKLTIICPGGEARFFSWHFKFTPGAGRIYFDPDNLSRKCYVGYIGKKLQ